MALLTLKDVGKIYVSDENVTVGIRGASLSFERGEFVAVTGKSGSGKSTLLNVISGIDSYEEGEIYGKFYKNEDLSKKVGCDVGELEYYLCGIDSYNDYYDEYRVMQKNVSHINSVHKELLSVSGQGDVFVFNDVRSSNKEHSESFRGELSVKLNSKGEIVSSWQPYDKPTAIRKTKNTNLILKDFNEKTGAIKGEVGVFVEDYNVEVGDFCEYGLFFDVEIENGKLNVIWDDSRVVIHD